MKTPILCISALALASVAWTAAEPVPVHASAQDEGLPVVQEPEGERLDMEVRMADLDFLAGVWAGSDGQSDWESSYTTGAGGQIVGASKEMRDGKVVMMDFEHFYSRDGKLRMTPYPFGTRSVEFTLTNFDAEQQLAVFENPDHDFPKSFVYQRMGKKTLEIVLQGDMGGQDARFLLEFTKQDV